MFVANNYNKYNRIFFLIIDVDLLFDFSAGAYISRVIMVRNFNFLETFTK